MEEITLVGIDLAKESIHFVGQNHRGRCVLRKRTMREKLLEILLQLPQTCRIAMEACASAHYWGRELHSRGYEVRLIAPQFVAPFRKSQKNDYNDAEAICEAASRESMRFVAVKSAEQQSLLTLHRIRERAIGEHTAVANQIRGHLMEHGVFIKKGFKYLRSVLTEQNEKLPTLIREPILELGRHLEHERERIRLYDRTIQTIAKAHPLTVPMMKLSGVGIFIASAAIADCADPRTYKNGRNYAASLGIVPKQYSTGGRTVLLGITKRGNKYLRTLLIHGARAAIRVAGGKKDPISLWVMSLKERKGANVAAVALANKNARMLWALMNKYYYSGLEAVAA